VEQPSFTRKPTDKEVREGQKVRFDAAASGVPKPTIKWLEKNYFLPISS
jgi:Immunoglobulin I-set domain